MAALRSLPEVAEINPRRFSNGISDESLVSFLPMKSVEEETGRLVPDQTKRWGEVKKGYTPFQNGDVVFAKITPCMENGKYALASGLYGGRAAGSTEFHVFRSKPELDPKYLLFFLFSPEVRREAKRNMRGAAGQLRVPAIFFEELEIPLPPLDQQERIVAEIEKQFTRLDAGVASLKRVHSELKRYRASVLKAACEGRLTDESKRQFSLPETLLDLAESDDAIANAEEALPLMPSSWRWIRVGKVLQTRQGVQIPKSEQRESEARGFKRYLYISDFKHSESMKFVKDEFPAQEVDERDLVMANTGSPGEVFCGTKGILSNNLFRISFSAEHFLQRFVYYYFKSPLFLSRIKLKGGAQQHLGHRTIAAHLMPLPPIAEQQRIVADVEQRLSVIEELEAVTSTELQRSVRLRQSILHQAFSGGI